MSITTDKEIQEDKEKQKVFQAIHFLMKEKGLYWSERSNRWVDENEDEIFTSN